jgi:hypothetical protein
MRTVKRRSLKLNKGKWEAIERMAQAFAEDKQAHGNIFPYFMERRWSSEDPLHNISSYVRQAKIPTLEFVCQPGVIDAQTM